jgi:hypothetical protein
MFTHTTVGTNNVDKARKMHDAALAPLGYARTADLGDNGSIWGGQFFVVKPADGNAATAGNGTTISLAAPSRKAVDEFHAAALAEGAVCAGPPGPRGFAPNAYAAYIRDLDGTKIVAVCTKP